MRDLRRRKFFSLTAAFAGCFSSLPSQLSGIALATANTTIENLVCGLLPDTVMAGHIAKAAVTLPGLRQKAEVLRKDINRVRQMHPRDEVEAIRSLISDRVQSDFDHGQTIKVNGWLLAVTEVEIIYLASKFRSI